MSDSNNEQPAAVTAKVGTEIPQVQAQQPEKPKSYTERFMEMEQRVAQMIYVVNFQSKAITNLLKQLDSLGQEVDRLTLVRQSVNAMIKMMEKGEPISLDAIAQKVSDIEQERTRASLKKDLDDGILVVADEIRHEFNAIEFSSPSVDYGVATINAFDEETSKLLIGKKAGDTAGDIKILGVYEQTASKEVANEQQDQIPTN